MNSGSNRTTLSRRCQTSGNGSQHSDVENVSVIEQTAGGISGRGLVVVWPLGKVYGVKILNDLAYELELNFSGSAEAAARRVVR